MPSPELERNTLRFYWRNRAETTVEHWDLNLAVVVDGVAVGIVKLFGNACGAVDVSGPAGERWWLTASFKPLRR